MRAEGQRLAVVPLECDGGRAQGSEVRVQG